MKLKPLLLLIALFATSTAAVAQLNSIYSVQHNNCAGDSNGVLLYEGTMGCFAPLEVTLDSFPAMGFHTLKNDGYDYINHGTGTGGDVVLGVGTGSTSIGDVYVAAGWFEDSITFDSITLYSNGARSMFVACFDEATSDVIWAGEASAGGSTYVQAYGATVLNNHVYVVGYMEGTTIFGTDTVVSAGGYQGFIAKYNVGDGSIDTVAQVGNAGTDETTNIHAGSDGRLYATGDFTGSITLAGSTFNSNGSYDMYVTCFDSTLSTNYWAATAGGNGIDVAQDVVAFGDSGSVRTGYVVGYMASTTASFGTTTLLGAGNNDFIIARVDTTGSWEWAMNGGGTGNDIAFSVDLSESGDRLYAAGTFSNSMTFASQLHSSNGQTDGFIAYVDSNGTALDLYQFGGTGLDGIYDLQSVSGDYLVFAAGHAGSWDFADSTFTSNGNIDGFCGKLGPGGAEIWGKNFGSSAGDAFNSIRLGSNGKMHTGGFIAGNASSYQSGLSAVGVSDAVVTTESYFGITDTTILLTGLPAGMHILSAEDSAGNSIVDTIWINTPDSLQISAFVLNTTNGTTNDGSIDVTVTGGTPGYSFLWSNASTTEDLNNLAAGVYSLTVTDSLGCIDSATYVVDSTGQDFILSATWSDVTCGGDSNGMIDLTVYGGAPPYDFAWSTGDSTEDLSGLSGGTYVVTVSDNDTGVIVDTFFIFEPVALTATAALTPPSNGTASDGAIDLTVNGGIMPYSYLWSTSDSTEDISGLPIGNYTVTVTDSTGCTLVETYFVDTVPTIILSFTTTEKTCINTDNGTIDLSYTGGLAPFSFNWSTGDTTEDVSGLAAGTYTVTVSDASGQVVSGSANIVANEIHPDPVVGPVSGNKSVQAWTVYPYLVPVSNGSSFEWTTTGGQVTSSTSNTANVLWEAGPDAMLYVTETDLNGCQATDSASIEILFVGIEEAEATEWLQVYPNPATNWLVINATGVTAQMSYQVYNAMGSLVLSGSVQRGGMIDVSSLSPAAYWIQVTSGQKEQRSAIIIHE